MSMKNDHLKYRIDSGIWHNRLQQLLPENPKIRREIITSCYEIIRKAYDSSNSVMEIVNDLCYKAIEVTRYLEEEEPYQVSAFAVDLKERLLERSFAEDGLFSWYFYPPKDDEPVAEPIPSDAADIPPILRPSKFPLDEWPWTDEDEFPEVPETPPNFIIRPSRLNDDPDIPHQRFL